MTTTRFSALHLLVLTALTTWRTTFAAVQHKHSVPDNIGECFPVGPVGDITNFHCLDTSTTPIVHCKNEHPQCEEWKIRGECRTNPQYMLYNCRQACEMCVTLHVGTTQRMLDVHQSFTTRSFLGALIATQQYVYDQAMGMVDKARMYQTCVNRHELCTHWKLLGECSNNAKYMTEHCPAACQTC